MKKLLLGALTIGLASLPISANAAGYANISVNGNANVSVGEEIKVDINISNIKDLENGMVGYSATVDFDDECLSYVGYEEKTNTPYKFIINEANYRIGGLDTSLQNGVKEDTTLYTLKFKANKACSSTVSVKNIKLSDSNAKPISVVENNGLTINATEKVEEVKTVETKEVEVKTTKTTSSVKTTTTTTTTETKTEPTTIEVSEKVETKTEEVKTTKKSENKIVRFFKNIIKSIRNIFRKEV